MKPNTIYQMYLRDFTGEGTLKGAVKMLSHIAELGVDTVYVSALCTEDESVSGQSPRQIKSGFQNVKNPYRIRDYFGVDEEFGSVSDLKEFVSAAHEKGLKVLIDLVYLHCGPTAVFLDENPDFVIRNEDGTIKVGAEWPFARLNYENKELREYLWKNMAFFVSDIGADGFRCDVGDGVPLDFWEEGVRRVKQINPNVYMLNEGSDRKTLSVFDSMYLHEAIFLLNHTFAYMPHSGKKAKHIIAENDETKYTLSFFKEQWQALHEGVPAGAALCNSENHDTVTDCFEERPERFLGADGYEAVLALLYTLDGTPMLYNGNEIADSGLKSLFWNRFCKGSYAVQWENALTITGKHRLALLKRLIALRKDMPALQSGERVWTDNGCADAVLSFTRGGEIKVYVNVTAYSQKDVLSAKSFDNILLSQGAEINGGALHLAPYGFLIAK